MSQSVTSRLMGDPGPGRAAEAPRPLTEAETIHALRYRPFSPPPPLPKYQTVEDEPETTLRPVAGICTADLALAPIPTGEPIFERVDPRTLLIEATYQRDLTEKSLALIRRIAANWDWRRFKPPVVAFADQGLQVIDGQHTAVGAASRPDISSIPVMVIEAPEMEARALAFIGHNRDRLQVTPMQLHHAAVASGEAMAATIERVCADAGARLVRGAYGAYRWQAGDTVAIVALRALIERQGERFTRMIMTALVEAERAPISVHDLKAAELLFTNADYVDYLEPLDEAGGQELAKAIKALGPSAEKEARMFAAAQCVPFWRGLAVTWFKKCRKRRKAI